MVVGGFEVVDIKYALLEIKKNDNNLVIGANHKTLISVKICGPLTKCLVNDDIQDDMVCIMHCDDFKGTKYEGDYL